MSDEVVRLATRASPLARLQTEMVADALRVAEPDLRVETVVVDTVGDRLSDRPLDTIAGRGVFTHEVDAAVARGDADLAVHSAKDLPSTEAVGAPEIVGVLARADVRDALVGGTLDGLPPGSIVATGAPRRRVQLASLRPDLLFGPLRGNIATRLDKVPSGGAVVVALAALERLGLADRADEVLSVDDLLPQVGQGVIAIRGVAGDARARLFGSLVDHAPTHRALVAERGFLRTLGGGCDAPVGAYALEGEDGALTLMAMIASADGHVVLRRREVGHDPDQLGTALAAVMLERDGGGALMGAWR